MSSSSSNSCDMPTISSALRRDSMIPRASLRANYLGFVAPSLWRQWVHVRNDECNGVHGTIGRPRMCSTGFAMGSRLPCGTSRMPDMHPSTRACYGNICHNFCGLTCCVPSCPVFDLQGHGTLTLVRRPSSFNNVNPRVKSLRSRMNSQKLASI